MKAIQVKQPGGPEALELVDLPVPQPKANEAVVKLAASGVNFIDVYQREGRYKVPLPFVAGQEGAGTVTAIGADVKSIKVGDRVAWTSVQGGYTEYAAVPADRLVLIPAGVSDREAAAVMLQGMTAHYLAYSAFPLKPGDTALIHAAAGGVGLLLVQLARHIGARVIGTVSTEEKAELARQAGADEIIFYTKTDFEAETKRLTGGKGVDVVYDSVGKTTFEKGLNVLRPRGMMVLFGGSSGAVPPFDPIGLSKGSLFSHSSNARSLHCQPFRTRRTRHFPVRYDRGQKTQVAHRAYLSAGGGCASPSRSGRPQDDGKIAADALGSRLSRAFLSFVFRFFKFAQIDPSQNLT